MIVYFDTSALLDTLLPERERALAETLWTMCERGTTSRLTYPEGRAALAAIRRADGFTSDRYRMAKRTLGERFLELDEIEPTAAICAFAGDLADRHGLRGYDAVHLASAMTLAIGDLILATDDQSLLRAAEAEGISTSL